MNCKLVVYLLLTLSVIGCQKDEKATSLTAAKIERKHSCRIDGMIVADYGGPKSQFINKQGERSFFCDTKEIFELILNPIQGRKIEQAWFQTFETSTTDDATLTWQKPDSLFFVGGSDFKGVMGPTFAVFKTEGVAREFAQNRGGKVYRFHEINTEIYREITAQGMNSF